MCMCVTSIAADVHVECAGQQGKRERESARERERERERERKRERESEREREKEKVHSLVGPIHLLGPVGPGPCWAHSKGFIRRSYRF